jgi:hypothetical protein
VLALQMSLGGKVMAIIAGSILKGKNLVGFWFLTSINLTNFE